MTRLGENSLSGSRDTCPGHTPPWVWATVTTRPAAATTMMMTSPGRQISLHPASINSCREPLPAVAMISVLRCNAATAPPTTSPP